MNKDEIRIAFTGGGTGGHVFPGLAVAEELAARGYSRFLWIGSRGGMEEDLVKRAGISYRGISSGKLRRYFSFRNFTDLFRIVAGYFQARRILKQERPDLLFSKGGFVSVPPVYAARSLGIPVFCHESDLDPGLATRISAGKASTLFVPYQQTREHLSARYGDKVVLSGNPVRRIFRSGDRERGRKMLGVPDGMPVLVVLGGSSGAAQINDLLDPILPDLCRKCFVVHQMGDSGFRKKAISHYYPAPFFNEELADILAAADLSVSRAGAGALWELAVTRTPAVLIPLGTATSRGDQIRNARIFEQGGMAVVLDPELDDSGQLRSVILSLLENPDRLDSMAKAAEDLAGIDSAGLIADTLIRTLERR